MKKKWLGSALALVGIVACSSNDDSADKSNLTVTISGEGASLTGYSFPPTSANDLAFVDGWEVRFDRVLVTVDDITLSDNPDTNPTDQSQVGREVAVAHGPWAVDMTKPGAVTSIIPRSGARPLAGTAGSNATGASQSEGKDPTAQPLARFASLSGNEAFDPASRYAFGFDIVNASATAQHANLDANAEADYAEMVAKGMTVFYVGTATFKGTDCKSSNPSYDFTKLPKTVRFRLGFKTPTKYSNCQNTDLHGRAFDGEEAQRGVQVSDQVPTVAQITLHVDHPFWNTVNHDAAELYFDQMAAAASADGTLAVDDLAKLDFTNFKDQSGADLPWRSCIAEKPAKTGTRRFDSGSVPVDPRGLATAALRNYADYVTYQQSTQGHLNADGLCAVNRQFAAPR